MQVLQKLLEGSFTFRRAIENQQQSLCRRGLIHRSAIVLRLRQRMHGAVQHHLLDLVNLLGSQRYRNALRKSR